MAGWFGGGGGFPSMGGLGDRLLGNPSGNPYTGGTGGAYGRGSGIGGGGSMFGGFGGGEGSLSADYRYLASLGRGGGPHYGTQPVGPRPMPISDGGPTLGTQPVGPRPQPFGNGQVPWGTGTRFTPMQPGGGSTGMRLGRGGWAY